MLAQLEAFHSEPEALIGGEVAVAPRLLVIDDENLHRLIICRVAVKAGYKVVEAGSYEEAVGLAKETAFDCISLDLSLGPHAGVEMLRHLWVIGSKAPIVIISGSDEATCRETVRIAKSLNLNVFDPIAKPVDLALLREFLEKLRLLPPNGAISEPAQMAPA